MLTAVSSRNPLNVGPDWEKAGGNIIIYLELHLAR